MPKTSYLFTDDEVGIITSVLAGAIENRADEDDKSQDLVDSALAERIERANQSGVPVELDDDERYDLVVALGGDWDDDDVEAQLIARLQAGPLVFTVEVTRTETVVYQVHAASAAEAEANYVVGEVMTSDGHENITVTSGEYDPSAPLTTDP